MLKNFFKFEKWFGIIILAAFLNMALFSYDALCAPTLSRDKAATLIQKSLSEVKTKVRLHNSGYQKGLQHGMWGEHNKSTYLTDRGVQYFQALNYSTDFWGNFAAQASGSGSGSVTLKKPVNVRVKVTGIRGGSAAEFTWEYVGLPSVVKRYVVRGGIGTAQFTLYDDGWRLINIHFNYSNEPALQTAKERLEDEVETREFISREQALQTEVNLAKQNWAVFIQEAMTPTEQLAHFRIDPLSSNIRTSHLYILDVGIVEEVYLPSQSWERVKIEHKPTPDGPRNAYIIGRPWFKNAYWFGLYSNLFDFTVNKDEVRGHRVMYCGEQGLLHQDGFLTFRFENEAEANRAHKILTEAYERWRDKNRDLVRSLEHPDPLFLEVLEENCKIIINR